MLYVVLVSGWCKVALAESDVMCHGNEQQIKKSSDERVKREKFLSKVFNKFSFALSRCCAVCGAYKVILILKNVQKRAWNAIQSVLAVAMEKTKFETLWKKIDGMRRRRVRKVSVAVPLLSSNWTWHHVSCLCSNATAYLCGRPRNSNLETDCVRHGYLKSFKV